MANDYYTPSGSPSTNAQGSSATMRGEFVLVKEGFEKLPLVTGNGDKSIFVNASGTGLEVKTAAQARALLGLVIGTDVQAYDATLASIAALGTVADRLAYTTGINTWAETPFTAFGRSIVDDADAATARTTLGLVIGTNVQAYDATLAALAGVATAADRLPYFTGVDTASVATFTAFMRTLLDDADAATARATLGLGSMATVASPAPVANGGTGASTAAAARSNLGTDNAANITTGTFGAGVTVPLARMQKNAASAKYSAGNVTTPLDTQVTLVTVDVGTVAVGDLIWANAKCSHTKGGGAGDTQLQIEFASGTGAVQAYQDWGGVIATHYQAASTTTYLSVAGMLKVTTAGTLVLRLTCISRGTAGTAVNTHSEIHAVTLIGT